LAVTDWRLRRWRLWFLALMKATRNFGPICFHPTKTRGKSEGKQTIVSEFHCYDSWLESVAFPNEMHFPAQWASKLHSKILSPMRGTQFTRLNAIKAPVNADAPFSLHFPGHK